MSLNIPTYPVLNDALMDAVWRDADLAYSFAYVRDCERHELRCDEIDDGTQCFKITDENGLWNPDRDNLIITRKYEFSEYDCLFGEGGIACSNAAIGVALLWYSRDSRQRGAIRIGQLRKGCGPYTFTLEHDFGNARLRGIIGLRTIMYIDQPGTQFRDEAFANTCGTYLGELDLCQIQIDGDGSVFPIYEAPEKGQPLWNVKCTWEDPTCDPFAESVEININTAHRSYVYLNKNKSKYDPQLMQEIMANALGIIIAKLKMDPCWDETISGIGFQHGSVSEAIYYFVSVLEWDVSTPESTAMSIRKYLDNKDIK